MTVDFRVEYTISGGSFFHWLVPEAKQPRFPGNDASKHLPGLIRRPPAG